MIGKLLAIPVKILNVPFRAAEKLFAAACGEDDIREEDHIVSKPLDALAKAIEEIDE